jgi:hypothetical protein
MTGSADDPLIARIAEELRRPRAARPGFEARVMAAVRSAPPRLPARAWAWLREPRALAVSPLAGAAMAAVLAAIVIVGARSATRLLSPGSGLQAAAPLPAGAPAVVRFVLVAPRARTVALAGDFDGWDRSRLPMRREAAGIWTVDVPLAPGRYDYAFVVDGGSFVADPAAPPAVGDDFGRPTSVVTVGGGLARAAGGSL